MIATSGTRWDPAVNDLEARADRYTWPSTVKHPNGSAISSEHTPFLVSATRHVLDLLEVS